MSRSVSDGIYDLVREPIRQGSGIDIGYAPGSRRAHGLLAGFELSEFRALASSRQTVTTDALWAATYHQMPGPAQDYLFAYIPEDALLLACYMPPWLRQACLARGRNFLDLRHSPLRFGRDMYIALDCSSELMRQRLREQAVCDQELRLEASLLAANLRAHRNRMEEIKRHRFDLSGTLVYVSQASGDSALLAADGHYLQSTEFAERIRALVGDRALLCMVDYSDEYLAQVGEQERLRLSDLLGREVRACSQSAYQILSAQEEVELVGISAALLQEASWFDKVAHCLSSPLTPLASALVPAGYLQVHFKDILAPVFWHQLLAPQAPAPVLARLPALDRHHGRETLDIWDDHEKVLNWERLLPWRAFERSGGIVQRRRIAALEHVQVSAGAARPRGMQVADESMRGRIQRLYNSKEGQTAYILGNAPSLQELDIDRLMARESFWCNRAFELEALGHTFRPKYYLMGDVINFQNCAERVMGVQADIKFFNKETYSLIERSWPSALLDQHILALEVNQTAGRCMFDSDENFSHDPSVMIYGGYTVVLAAIQLAFYMGFSRVLVGGVDLDYSKPYFYGSRHTRKQEDMDVLTDYMRRSFQVARKHFEREGRLLAKITPSPHLPLEHIEDPEVYRRAT